MTLSLHGVTRLTSPRLQSLPSDIPYSPENSVLTTLLTDTSVHSYPLWLPGKAKQGISLEKDEVSRLWHMGDYPRAGNMLPDLSPCLVWMPRARHAFPSPWGLSQFVSAVDAQAEHPLLGGGGSPPTEHSWESTAFPSHAQAPRCAAGVCRCISQELVLALVAARQKSECDQKVSGGNWAISHHLFLSFSQAFLFLFLFFSLVLYHLHCTPRNGSNCLGSVSAPVCHNKQLFLRERSSCD